jgi:hypothetical protein
VGREPCGGMQEEALSRRCRRVKMDPIGSGRGGEAGRRGRGALPLRARIDDVHLCHNHRIRDRSAFVAVAVIRCLLLAVPLLVALVFLRQQNMDVPIWHYVSGRPGGCSLQESIEGAGLSRLQIANVEAVRRAMRVVRTDDGYTLWATPYG